MNATISILGCGWYGLPLAKKLVSENYKVNGSTTSEAKLAVLKESGISPYLINLQDEGTEINTSFFDAQILIICIPPKRNTSEQKLFSKKIETIIQLCEHRVSHVIFISSISVYGNRNAHFNEFDVPNPDTGSGKMMLEAEEALKNNTNFTTTVIRFGGLIGPNRDPGRFFAGKENIPNGRAPINLILLDDCIDITTKILQFKSFGHTYNACHPDHPAKQWFYTKASSNSLLPAPSFIDELDSWKVIESENVSQILNYKYSIQKWLEWLS